MTKNRNIIISLLINRFISVKIPRQDIKGSEIRR